MDEPKVTQARGTFSLTCKVEIAIQAAPDRIWALLTDAVGYPRWNSTVATMEGRIAEGQRLKLTAPGMDRVFTPKVSGVVTSQHMVWSDGFAPMFKGVRSFALKPTGSATAFAMEERFSGLMLPLIAGALPDFGPIFGRFAADLKQEAERAAG